MYLAQLHPKYQESTSFLNMPYIGNGADSGLKTTAIRPLFTLNGGLFSPEIDSIDSTMIITMEEYFIVLPIAKHGTVRSQAHSSKNMILYPYNMLSVDYLRTHHNYIYFRFYIDYDTNNHIISQWYKNLKHYLYLVLKKVYS